MRNKMNRKSFWIIIIGLINLVLSIVTLTKNCDFSLAKPDFTLSNENGSICISWDMDEQAIGYRIYRETDGDKELIAMLDKVDNYIDNFVESGKEYEYSLISYSDKGQCFGSYKKKQVYVSAPKIETNDVTKEGIEIGWSKSENAQAYNIYRIDEKQNGWNFISQVSADKLSYCDKNINHAEKYVYCVSAVSQTYESAYSNSVCIHFIDVPENVKAINCVSGVELNWDKVSMVDGYELYRRTDDSEPWLPISKINSRDTTKYLDRDVSDGTLYQYKINTYYAESKSDYNTETVRITFVAPTVINKIKNTATGISVSWINDEKCDGYKIYRKEEKEDQWTHLTDIKDKDSNNYTDITAKSGKRYSYSVIRCMGDYASELISTDGYSCMFIKTPELSVKNSPSGVKLKWNKSEGAVKYLVYRKGVSDEKWKKIAQVTGEGKISYTDKKAPYGEKTRYKIRAWADENSKSFFTKPAELYAVDPKKPMVALTYDDGPYAPVTNSIISTLKKNNGRATFFLVGSRVAEFEDCLRRADKIGCEIANHTYEHTILTKVKKKKIQSEISKTNKAVESVIGKSPVIVRAPGGAVDDNVKKYVKYPLINWSVDTLDWKYRDASSVISRVKSQVGDGSIVLMHDLYASTAEASKTIIPWLVDKGYQLVTVSEMMDAKGVNIERGNLYTSAR